MPQEKRKRLQNQLQFETSTVQIQQKLEEAQNEVKQNINEDCDKIYDLHESLPDVLKIKKLITGLQAYASGEGVIAYLKKLDQRIDDLKARVEKRDQDIASLSGTSAGVSGSSQLYQFLQPH